MSSIAAVAAKDSALKANQSKTRLFSAVLTGSWITLTPVGYSLLFAAILTFGYNRALFSALQHYQLRNTAVMGLLLGLLNLLLVSLLAYRPTLRLGSYVLVIIAASSQFFMQQFGIVIDKDMLQNVVETDMHEAAGLISWSMLWFAALYIAVPIALLSQVKLKWQGWKKRRALLVTLLSAILLVLWAFSQYQSLASTFRNHRDIKHLATPINALSAAISVGNSVMAAQFPHQFSVVGADATLSPAAVAAAKPTLIIFVLGETARADHFSVNGYSRNTNPRLAKQDITVLQNVSSCGTATALSVPCMFSALNRSNYKESVAKNADNFLDVLQRAGVNVQWRDNNSGCKGMCDRIPTTNLFETPNEFGCTEEYCSDLALLQGLDTQLVNSNKTTHFVVLHQQGSHGPEYYKRSSDAQKQFLPECRTNQLGDCSADDITNAYDNSIVATDIFLNATIELLKSLNADYNTAMIYVSDHGESLGESGLYLHGIPYWMAPDAQTKVPFIMWYSDDFFTTLAQKKQCIAQLQQRNISHDNLFDSMLGLMQVNTSAIRPEQNIFANCFATH